MAGLGGVLSTGGAVLRGINEGNDEADSRAYLKRVRESGTARMDAEDSLRPAQTAAPAAQAGATTAQAGLQTDTAVAQRGMLPARTKLEATNTDIAQQTADNTLGILGTHLDASNTDLRTKLINSKNALTEAGFRAEQLPTQIQLARSKGLMDTAQVGENLAAGAGHLITLGDHKALLKYVQDAAAMNLTPALSGKQIASLGEATGEDGQPYIAAADEAGKVVWAVPTQFLINAYAKTTPAQLKEIPYGGKLARVNGDGTATVVAENPKAEDGIKREENATKSEDARMTRGKAILDSTFKANSLNGLMPESEPLYIKAAARMGELVRTGMAPEAAAKKAYEEIKGAEKKAADAGPSGTGKVDIQSVAKRFGF